MAAAARKRTGKQRGASRGRQGTPAWMWLLTGILIGLVLAWYLWSKDLVPQPGRAGADAIQAPPEQDLESSAASEEVAPAAPESKTTRYDFFTVLPEMEVVVPERELSGKDQPQMPENQTDGARYLLQVGSFKQVADAEQMKARLALQGIVSSIQEVSVNDSIWHRVRVGPVSSARQADELRRQLGDLGYDSLVMQDQ
ncbi:MAG: SPOR domain-containing protein [Xanthomonadales bacterium]|nr:SPOR domain-containing protein [Xanthomonadales bacterium]